MVGGAADAAGQIARLEARVERLEKLLAARSRLLRELTDELCPEDLVNLSRLASGLPALLKSAFGIADWRETTALTGGDVEKTMKQLWRSTARRHDEEE
ncbi:MAG TPA: hypothetical protein VMR54_10170 [Thermoanaerobaculia bacterium]|nr:hypothetical protein [Thermoanaerobaculia bacterium]